MGIDINRCYKISDDVIARKLEGQTIIVPIKTGVVDLNEEIFALNHTGTIIWESLDGNMPLTEIIKKISKDYDKEEDVIKKDIIDIVSELFDKKLIYLQ